MTTNENPAKHTQRTPGTRRTKRTPRGPRPFTPAELQARRDAVPTITYPAQLPVSARKADIALEGVADARTVILQLLG